MKRFAHQLQYDWWRYGFLAVLIAALWISAFNMQAKPKDHEKLAVCYFGDDFSAPDCEKALSGALSRYTAQPLKVITAEHRGSKTDAMLTQLVETGVYAGDLLVFEQGVVEDWVLQSYINRLDTARLEAYLGMTPDYYIVEGVPYGVVLQSLPGYSGTAGCIVCLSPYSVNLAGMYGSGSEQYDVALAALRFWMEEQQ